jgi:hypothetical protein
MAFFPVDSNSHRSPFPRNDILMTMRSWVLPGFILAGLVLLWGNFLFTVDDAFISMRYAENLARGVGPVFNPGERVEGYSTPLWVALLAILAWLPGDLLLPSKLLSSAAFLACGILLLRRLLREGINPLPAAFLYLGSVPLFVWGVSGMETTLFACLLLLWAFAVAEPEPDPGRVLILAMLLLLARPEAPLPIGIGFAALTWRGRLPFRLASAFAALVLALLAARYAYYGDILPNTYYAKRFQTPGRWAVTLWNYVRTYFLAAGLVPAAGVLAYLWKSRSKEAAAVAALCLWPALFCMLVGGDWMPQWRFMAAGLPVSIWLTARALHAWTAHLPAPGRPAAICAPLLLHLAAGAWLAPGPQPLDFSPPTRERILRAVGNGNPHYAEVARRVAALEPAPRSLAVGELGFFCHQVRVPCVDLHGLIDPIIAKSREFPNTVIGKKLPVGEAAFRETDLGRYLLHRAPDVWILSLEETGGPREEILGGAWLRLETVGNFQVYRAAVTASRLAVPARPPENPGRGFSGRSTRARPAACGSGPPPPPAPACAGSRSVRRGAWSPGSSRAGTGYPPGTPART